MQLFCNCGSRLKTSIQAIPAAARRHASSTSLQQRPFRVGIVGGGPAGFYAASRLLDMQGSENLRVDLFELLPVPFGLSRFGVAPDHPEVKNCEHKFEEAAKDARFRFFGNVQVSGTTPTATDSTVVPNLSFLSEAAQIPLSELSPYYDAIILSYGASVDRQLGIKGEDTLRNVLSARSFVNWYNGHPYHSSLLAPLIDLSQIEHVSVIGQGNVALDVARVLLKSVDELRNTDLPEHVLAELARSRVKRVDLVGRRGALQLACTTKEVREMLSLSDVAFDGSDVREAIKSAQAAVEANPGMKEARMRKRMLSLVEKGSKASFSSANLKSWSFQFLRSPVELLPETKTPQGDIADALARNEKVAKVRYELNELVGNDGSGETDPTALSARGTGQFVECKTDLVMKSVGYRSIGLPGLPFDSKRGVVRNVDGRVVDEAGQRIENLYTCGWLARGPTGVIATTMFGAFSVADTVAQDLLSRSTNGDDDGARPVAPVEQLAKGKKVVTWREWEEIDRVEKERGAALGKPREKVTTVAEMLRIVS